MRLTKVQKALKAKGIDYNYEEAYGCGEITFTHNGKWYMVAEFTGNRGKTPIGICTNLPCFNKWASPTQTQIVECIAKSFTGVE